MVATASPRLQAGVYVATGSDGRFQAVQGKGAVGKGFKNRLADDALAKILHDAEAGLSPAGYRGRRRFTYVDDVMTQLVCD